jgi:hypothetical protein
LLVDRTQLVNTLFDDRSLDLSELTSVTLSNEDAVVTKLILPLLRLLSFGPSEWETKYPVAMWEGRAKRVKEADVLGFRGTDRSEDDCPLVAEAKKAGHGRGDRPGPVIALWMHGHRDTR